MQVLAYNLSVQINPGPEPNLAASAEISLKNGPMPCNQFSLYLNPDFELTEFSVPKGICQTLDNPHPLGYAGRELRITFQTPVQPGVTVPVSLQWQGRLKGIIWGYCMIAPHLTELRDFACWYPLQGGDIGEFSWEMDLDVPAQGYPLPTTVLCNGTIQSSVKVGTRLKLNWQSEGSTDINIITSNWFQHKHKSWSGMSINMYYAFLSPQQAEIILDQMLSAWKFFTNEIGENQKLREINAVFSPRYAEGGYVYGPLTVMSEPQYQHYISYPKHSPPVSIYGNAHELAHYWWREQVSVDRSTWHDWLMEALAEYWASMFDGTVETDRAQVIYRHYRERVVGLIDPLPMVKTVFDTPCRYEVWYLKGSWIIRMLRKNLGEGDFRRAIQLFYGRFQGRRAETEDFINCCEEVSMRDLSHFFNQWLRRSDLPVLSLDWRQVQRDVEITITQHQSGQPFHLDIELLIDSGRRGQIEQAVIHNTVQTHRFPVSGQVTSVHLDPRELTLFRRQI